MVSITNEELKQAMELYEKTKQFQYGSIQNRAARNRYEKYTKTVAENHGIEQSYVHNLVIMERRRQRNLSKNR
jgi:hypothetical protein